MICSALHVTHGFEDSWSSLVSFIQTDPFVGHGFAETNLPALHFLKKEKGPLDIYTGLHIHAYQCMCISLQFTGLIGNLSDLIHVIKQKQTKKQDYILHSCFQLCNNNRKYI